MIKVHDMDQTQAAAIPVRFVRATSLVLFIVCLMYLITYIDRVNIATAGPLIQRELELSNRDLGIAISAFAYPYAFFQIVGGLVSDRFGPRLTLIVCGAIWSLATVATGWVGGFASLIAARLLLGIGEGCAFPAATRALSAWMSKARRGWAHGITHSFARLGNALTPPLIAALIGLGSWRTSFFIVGSASFLWVLLWASYFRDDPRDHKYVTADELKVLPDVKPHPKRTSMPWRRLLIRMLPVTLTDFCYGWTLWVYISWMPSFFLHEYKLDLKNAAFFASAVLLAGVVGDTVGGVLSDVILKRTGSLVLSRTGVIVLGFLGAFACTVPIFFAKDLYVIAACLGGAFFFAELIVAPIWAVPMDITPEYSGTASGFMNLGFGIAGMVSPVTFGWIIDATGRWDLPFLASLGLLLIGALLALTMQPGRRLLIER
ncbi:MFS transporter [Bradyrhizobium sp.]|uniref:MFS transporter n=1 Tax=Bradyrhizobium sp. TaxID=376 RepID=UPI0025C688A9|nr:MFS transporter [Bradyrhizobium sp.]